MKHLKEVNETCTQHAKSASADPAQSDESEVPVVADNRCIEIVYSTKPGDFKPRRCNRPAGHGKDGAYCSAHSVDNSKIEPLPPQKPIKRRIWGGNK